MKGRRSIRWLLVGLVSVVILGAAVLARLVWEPLELPTPASPPEDREELPPEPGCGIRGEPGGYATKEIVKSLSSDARDAFILLANSRKLCWEAIDSDARTPESARAFRLLAREVHAAEAFAELVDSATLPGQLYGLAGLYLTSSGEFAKRVRRYEEMGEDAGILSQFGCTSEEVPVGSFVKRYITTGEFPERLLDSRK